MVKPPGWQQLSRPPQTKAAVVPTSYKQGLNEVPSRKGTNGKQPPHVPTGETRAKAWFMSVSGVPQARIGEVIGISDNTLRKHYRRELTCGMTEANTAVARNLYGIATGKSAQAASAAMFWLKTRAGWRETGEPDDAPERPPRIYINFVGPGEKDE
jgi:hypothetical protein